MAKEAKKKVEKEKKETKKAPKERYLKSVRKELKLVKWPTAKEVLKYTISTLVFCLFIVAFFIVLNLIMSFVKGLFV